ncbi:MAG: gliding motility-associated C-terminal domain-containing protein [Flavobacteriaceae bacterium]|nr:gliding motility-associated C-terminal domain-containing protein [Flavobacteriaceae bacterium]
MIFSITASAQFRLQAPNTGDISNYQWLEASDTSNVLSTQDFLVVSSPGVYFATYDGTSCGKNATSYFIVTNCNAPDNEVILDISNSVPAGATVSWSPNISGNQLQPTVIATETVITYRPSVTKIGNIRPLPSFTVVCLQQAANLVDDLANVDEDDNVVIPIFDNDTDLPSNGTLALATNGNAANGTVNIDNNGTPNDPTDDIVTYTPNPDFNGTDSFQYEVCDNTGACSVAKVVVTVNPIVDAIDDIVATDMDIAVTIDFLSNDNDFVATDILSIPTNPNNGVLTINDNGTPNDLTDDSFLYTPNSGFVGNDSFTYQLCDAANNCSTATVTIAINATSSDIDADNDGIVDTFEDLNLDGDSDPDTDPTDTDKDGLADYLDIDSDNDGIPDNVEAQNTADYIVPGGNDTNNNGLDDAYEENGVGLGIIPEDTDSDGEPDYIDSDSDNDTIPDSIEGHDHDHDGVADYSIVGVDTDNDGLDDGFEGTDINDADVNDQINIPLVDLPNTDEDAELDYRDIDDDEDGILTVDEYDTNGDGIGPDDDNNNGTPNYLDDSRIPQGEEELIEVYNVLTPNGDGVHDYLKVAKLENYPDNKVQIFNRWGRLVFSTKAYDTEGNVFKGINRASGTTQSSKELSVGTYFYIIEFVADGRNYSKTGYLYLNR